ncbi:MAG: hypothetical protein EOO01_41590, partial [Chitinophagaceae bacterium]
MKNIQTLFIIPGLFLLAFSADTCKSKKAANGVYKAKLEIKGICSNYTLRLLEGDLDTTVVTANWTDETTGKSYKNVFGLANPCSFPASIQEGNEFYFQIDSSGKKD